ncbi:Short-chain dehydrogenase [Streptomyces sp. DvalAA-14]|uniref:SDR family oxidoreductase n=1 Tax=unclassified Streptomyces TaxID=2593676 RepID=UPI00081B10E4|nr:SDR family oxidoreductase [Streptomyces sp. DvalAA-14]MYS23207.1 SDR family NAD(P)-dependent oxidoreductase [Streptomyces sp. SID4948]SCE29449.1 Short-chain dehydrogenase [Streptomyces sp. DvalAA-14]
MSAGYADGRVAVVTGAARGVGAAVARELSARGLRVVLLGRELDSLREVADGLPGDSCCIEADVTDEAAMQGAARSVAARFGPASVVVANAGIAQAGPFAACDAALWNRVIDVNLIGSAVTARVFLPQLVRTRGYLLQVASTAAFGSAPMMSAYCASKAGVESFARALRMEMEPEGVAVGIAYLHWTGTDMIGELDEHVVLRELRRHQPAPARRVYTAARVATWLVHAVERRSPTVYAPPWLRVAQPLRPLFPYVVARVARRSLARMSAAELHRVSGVLGTGGRADWDGARPAAPTRPTTPPQT